MKNFFNLLTKHWEKISAIGYIILATFLLVFVYWLFKNLAEGFKFGWDLTK